jgi:isoleucyl-tRNA synthetase
MALARQIVELGRRVRVESKTKVRQPLLEAVVSLPGRESALSGLVDVVAEELNVKTVRVARSADAFGAWTAKPNFKVLGPRLGSRVQALAAMLARDDGTLSAALAAGQRVDVSIDEGPPVGVGPGDVELERSVREGWGVASDAGVTVALELEITPELRLEGLARDLVRIAQDARKAAGLDVSDRIVLAIETGGAVADALARHRDLVASETLAIELGEAALVDAVYRTDAEIDGTAVTVSLRPA